MITWLAIKAWSISAWNSFVGFCKERWELVVGIVVGVLGMLAITRRDRDTAKVLEEKNNLVDTLLSSEQEATAKEREALKKNLDTFLSTNEEVKKDFESKISRLDQEKKDQVKKILTSESPEEQIALKLREYLD